MSKQLNRRELLQLTALAYLSACSFTPIKRGPMSTGYDIVIIGGGPAGLTAALTAARGRRTVLVIDAGKARNAPAAHMMNFPTREGTPPFEFRELIRENLRRYPTVEYSDQTVQSIVKTEDGFLVDGIAAKKILLAHGVRDILPAIPGMRELFGKAIFHCPYCHGFEHADAPMGVVGNTEYLQHMVPLIKGLSSDVVAFDENDVAAYVHRGERLTGVQLKSGMVVPRSYVFSFFAQEMTSDLGKKLGCALTEQGRYQVNMMNETTVPGVFAAGDCVTMAQSVLSSCATGQLAGAAMNATILHTLNQGA